MQKMAATRGGGAYIPPARLRAMQAEIELQDSSSPEYQRLRWDALRKSINGLINKVNVGNIKFIVPELFGENLIRGRGLFARSIMRAQASSLPFTPVFAALVSIINTKLPSVGELLVTRVVSQFRRAYRRNDKVTCVATSIFIAQLVNQQVAHHLLAFEIIILLLEKPTDDSVEIAVGFTKEVGAFLSEAEPKANNSIYERFRSILHEATISKRVQYMIEVLFQVRKDRFKDNLVFPEGLDLVEEDDIITHPIHLDDDLQVQEGLNAFKFDPEYVETEEKYQNIKNEILGADSDSSSGGSGSDSDTESSDDEVDTGIVDGKVSIHDHTGTNLINFRRNVYLTIMSSLDFEEAAHKLLKKDIEDGLELELANMVVECCSQERSFAKFYGLLGERFCKLNQTWAMTFEQCFRNYYDTIHRFETNRLRNIARLFGHLLAQDAIPWTVFEVIKMNEDDTTSSSRIFVKIMFQELSEVLGLKRLAERFKETSMKAWTGGLFPIDNPKNTRFSINYFTSIGLGVLTEDMREHLKRAPQIIMAQRRELENAVSSSDGSSSDTSSVSTTDSSDESDEETNSSSGNSLRISHRERRARSGRDRGDRRNRDSPLSPPHRKDDRHRDTSGRARQKPLSPNRDSDLSPPSKYSNGLSSRRRRSSHSSGSSRRNTRHNHNSHLARRRNDSPLNVNSNQDSPPLRRRGGSPSPVRRHRDSPSPVRQRRSSPSAYSRRREAFSPDHKRHNLLSPARDRRSILSSTRRPRDSPSPARRRDGYTSPARRSGSVSSPSRRRSRNSPSLASPRGHLTSIRNRRRSPSTVPYDRKSPSPRRGRKLSSPTRRRRDSPPPAPRRYESPPRRRESPSRRRSKSRGYRRE
ncbi:hypothetical protein BY996DRAFT_8404519 [Phakopsora pachyrhizi]|nr:hypothetical protein BY996DRAFT_8404519 [Phakopsora pachyrhizi]